jgi:hypothetical protein
MSPVAYRDPTGGRAAAHPVAAVLRTPAAAAQLALRGWERLVRDARHADLLPRVAMRLDEAGLADAVPAPVRPHLLAARRHAAAQREEVLREVRHVARALAPLEGPVVVLKGAAYLAAGLPAAAGRTFGDIDILVPRAQLPAAEAALMLAGWSGTGHDAYDQRYYREWMHELPPMQHVRRGTTLDVHHAIVPLTARQPSPAAPLFAAARPLRGEGVEGLHTLAPADMVLHSMVHLVHNEEFTHGLRDLSDLDALLRHFGTDAAFWLELDRRATVLALRRPLHHGLRAVQAWFATPVPASLLAATARDGPRRPAKVLMRALFARALGTPHPDRQDFLHGFALAVLHARAHALRMPPRLLLPHLATKAWKRRFGPPAEGA